MAIFNIAFTNNELFDITVSVISGAGEGGDVPSGTTSDRFQFTSSPGKNYVKLKIAPKSSGTFGDNSYMILDSNSKDSYFKVTRTSSFWTLKNGIKSEGGVDEDPDTNVRIGEDE
jgi:hypothetical protein